jgi:hypothetical protein
VVQNLGGLLLRPLVHGRSAQRRGSISLQRGSSSSKSCSSRRAMAGSRMDSTTSSSWCMERRFMFAEPTTEAMPSTVSTLACSIDGWKAQMCTPPSTSVE